MAEETIPILSFKIHANKFADCPVNSTLKCLDNGAEVLYENGYSTNYILEDSLGNLFVFIVWSVLGYWGLKREENKGYAY